MSESTGRFDAGDVSAPARWMPVLAAALMAAVTAAVWWSASGREQGRIRRLVEGEANAVSQRIRTHLDVLTESLQRMAIRWSGTGTLTRSGAAVESALLLRDPTVSSVLWLDVEGELLWAMGPDVSPAPGQVETWIASVRDPGWDRVLAGQRLVVSRAMLGPSGAPSFLASLPILLEEGPAGVMVGVVDLEEWLRVLMTELGTQLAVVVRPQGVDTELDTGAQFRALWAAHRDLAYDDLRLHVAVWPSDAMLASLRSALPRTVLVGGLVFALLLGVAIRLGQVEGMRARDAAMATALRREIDARTHAEDQLAARARALERSNYDLLQFARVVSHDLREPLNVIAMRLQLLRESAGDADALDRHVAKADRASDRMVQMIDGLLAYSGVGGAEKVEMVDTSETLRRALANVDSLIRASGAMLRFDELPVVEGHPDQLTQLFQNLVGNALKHSGQRTPRIGVRCERRDHHWLFRVEDAGPGIPADRVDRIFELFDSGGETAGSGVGLAICRRIVETSGGRIWVRSSPGDGSTFYFTWPLAVAEPRGARPPSSAAAR